MGGACDVEPEADDFGGCLCGNLMRGILFIRCAAPPPPIPLFPPVIFFLANFCSQFPQPVSGLLSLIFYALFIQTLPKRNAGLREKMITLSLPSPAKPNLSPFSSVNSSNPIRLSRQKPLKQNLSFNYHHNRLINLVDSGQLHQAISALDQFPPPSATTPEERHQLLTIYSHLLKSCIRFRNFKLGQLVHSKLAQSQIVPDAVILNSLISLYAKFGDTQMAEKIFNEMGSEQNLVSWSALISCYSNNGKERDALSKFIDLLELGSFYPNEYCFTAVTRACSNVEFFPLGKVIYGFVIKTGYFKSDVCVGCSLIDMFVKGDSNFDSAIKVFDRMPEKNVVSWTLMLTRCAQLGYLNSSVDLFFSMLVSGYEPDRFTLSGIIAVCAELGVLSFGIQLHSLVLKLGLGSDVCVGCSLVDMYAKCGGGNSMNDSRRVFDKMPEHNVMSWTAMITGYVQSGAYDREAIVLYDKMIKSLVSPNYFTFSSVLKACGNLSNLVMGEQVYSHAVKMGLASVYCVGNSVISMYARCSRMEDARKAFDILFEKNLVSYNALVDGLAKNSESDEAFEVFHWIEDNEIETSAFTFASLLSGAASIGAIGKGEQIHARVLKSDLKTDVCICNALISMYSRCGDIEAASQVFTEMESRNVISWTSIITGFAKHGFATRALELFQEMLQAHIKPNEVTYIAVLSACSHVGMVSEGQKYFNSMYDDHGVIARMEHYACMVDLFGRSGLLSEALEFICSMPFKADALVWRTLLGACRIHGNLEMGKYAAKMILEQDPHDPSAYILLSNLYASTGQWEDVSEIRKNMKQKNLVKEAGCSWIETENKVHKFHVGDTLHPRAREIYTKLDELALRIKKLGYVPKTDLVLHDVEEEQKEQYLFQHSEKIAVAYGLISSSAGKPIRVFKNLRVCGDCHSAIKYIAAATGREIVLRDSNRFHHFKDGECSCRDYW